MLDPGTNLAHDGVFSHQNYYYGNFRGAADEDVSGTDTPPMWRGSPPPSPPPRPEVNYRCLSPDSKAQAIARGQKELMEMVSRMPESCYELSLKDLVEQPLVFDANTKRNDADNFRREIKKRSDERKIRSNRSGRYENHNGGLFLKTVIPVYVGVNRCNRKKIQHDLGNNGSGSNSRVSPKPPPPPAAESDEKEWWKKRLADSSGSESIGSSTRSGSTKSSGSSSRSRNSNSSRHQPGGGCWSFFRCRKSKRF